MDASSQMIPGNQSRDSQSLEGLFLHVFVDTHDGDRIQVNIPATLVKICVERNVDPGAVFGKASVMNKLDLNEILQLIQQGSRGKIMEITSRRGDRVEIVAE